MSTYQVPTGMNTSTISVPGEIRGPATGSNHGVYRRDVTPINFDHTAHSCSHLSHICVFHIICPAQTRLISLYVKCCNNFAEEERPV